MDTTIQETLLDLFHQVIDDPDCVPTVPVDAWPEDSEQRRLLKGFRAMLECMQQSRQKAERQLREREEQYRNVFEASFDGLNISTLDGPIQGTWGSIRYASASRTWAGRLRSRVNRERELVFLYASQVVYD